MPDTAARIHHMTEADTDQVSALIHASWVRTYGPLMGEERAELESAKKHRPEMIAADLKRMHSESFVGEAPDGRIVGYAYAKVEKGYCGSTGCMSRRPSRAAGSPPACCMP
ncbi:hypothetical protein [Mesorhizobium sp. J428]|uniref:hypothetical protein n=1 Tax=Mesorhizobium sp. J428 TaxID=2898440 RepID=UPI0021510E77|nr:hypothetical protein [Mesorhizobium sp. J428]MCR5860063.1 hypothetical protein [Mesorhizobium sp. J428]